MVGTRVPRIYVLAKIRRKKYSKILLKIHFYNFKNLCILHGHVFVMYNILQHVEEIKIKLTLIKYIYMYVFIDKIPRFSHTLD